MDHAVVQRWLRQVLAGPYAATAERVFADVDRVLLAFSSLAPRTEVYTHDDGRSQLLLELAGTVPIEYKRATYHIPVSFWIPHGYPREAPIVYVTPTSTMLVRRGKHVDPNGRVGGAYLDTWARKPEACNLLDLVHSCRDIFSQQPPVYAKPTATASAGAAPPSAAGAPAPGPAAARASPAPPLPSTASPGPAPAPLPGHAPTSGHPNRYASPPPIPGSSTATPPPTHAPPARPPPPPTSSSSSSSASLPSSQPYAQPSLPPAHANAQPPAPPLKPPLGPAPVPSPFGAQPQAYGSPHQSGSPALPYQQAPSQPPALPPPHPPLSAYPGPPGSGPGGAPARPGTTDPAPTQAIPTATPPPPRPLNPELLHLHTTLHARLQSTLAALATGLAASNAQLGVLVADLERGRGAIEDERARLEAVRDVCRVRAERVRGVVEEGRRARAEVEAKEAVEREDVDGFVVATSLVGNQLLTLVAEDHALEDTLYQLGRALNAERIDLDRFLKQTRHLAREQFMRRALARKICEGMRWPTE